ncbi:MAG: Gldg family protein [Lachnospiraceae bacterium]|nr:Gldg family protein [Lachnospiraceae bacterium]
MLAIFKREFKSLFQNVIGWLFVGVLLALYGLYFTVYNLMGAYPTISYTVHGVVFVVLIAVPILTMRSLAEERKSKTDQLLLTAPISVFKIVFGKFLALAATYSIVCGVICISPVILAHYGTVDFAQNYIAVLGFWLYGLVCIAIGLFISSLFENQILAAIISFAVLFAGYMMSAVVSALSLPTLISKVLNCYDLMTPLSNFLSGNLELSDLIYDVSLIALMIFLTTQVILKRRWSVSATKVSFTVFSTSGIIVGVAVCILVNFAATYIPDKYATIDVTTSKLYSLTEDTKNYLDSLEEDITVYVIGKESAVDEIVSKMVNNYDEASKHISVEYVDTESNPTFVSNYTDADLSTGSLIVVCGEMSKVVSYDDMYEYEVDYTTYSQSVTGYDGEGLLTSALQYVTSDDLPVIYQLEGHDETSLSSSYTDAVSKANMTLETLNLLTVDAIPDDCSALIIHAPQTDFSEDDVAKILAYMAQGGNVFITLDFNSANDLTNVKSLLSNYSVSVEDGLVADMDRNYYYQLQYFLLPEVKNTDATSDVFGTMSILAPYSLALTYPEDADVYTYTPLMTTSESAVLKQGVTSDDISQLKGNSSITAEEGEAQGTYTLGLEVDTDNGGTLFVYGSSYIFTDSANQYVSGRNAELFTDNLSLMTSDEESSSNAVVVASKSYDMEYLTTSANAVLIFGIVFGILIPLLAIVLGIIIWALRRRR